VAARLGVDGVDFETTFERGDDEVAHAVRDGRGVWVDDDQHAPLYGHARRLKVSRSA